MKSEKEKTLEDLFMEELKDVYDAEKQLVKALPKIAKAATSETLMEAINEHLEQTKGHVERLEAVFEECGVTPRGKTCEAMKGLLKEGSQAIEELPMGSVRDAALIAGGQRIEHYEIAAYGTLRAFAEQLGKSEAIDLLQETLDEEKAADEKLNEIATTEVNEAAMGGDMEEEEEEGEMEEEEDAAPVNARSSTRKK